MEGIWREFGGDSRWNRGKFGVLFPKIPEPEFPGFPEPSCADGFFGNFFSGNSLGILSFFFFNSYFLHVRWEINPGKNPKKNHGKVSGIRGICPGLGMGFLGILGPFWDFWGFFGMEFPRFSGSREGWEGSWNSQGFSFSMENCDFDPKEFPWSQEIPKKKKPTRKLGGKCRGKAGKGREKTREKVGME